MQHRRVNLAFADVKSQVQHGDYKIENYDRVKTSVLMQHSVITDKLFGTYACICEWLWRMGLLVILVQQLWYVL